jgi:uncharacterized membrane protein
MSSVAATPDGGRRGGHHDVSRLHRPPSRNSTAATCGPTASALRLLIVTGTCEALGSLALWAALGVGKVSVVMPLVYAQPMFTVLLAAAILLRDVE